MEYHASHHHHCHQQEHGHHPCGNQGRLGISPGYRLNWQLVEGREEILVHVIPDRGELARRLLGAGREFSPGRVAVAEQSRERRALNFTEKVRGLHKEFWPADAARLYGADAIITNGHLWAARVPAPAVILLDTYLARTGHSGDHHEETKLTSSNMFAPSLLPGEMI
jgi:hypothetical protein